MVVLGPPVELQQVLLVRPQQHPFAHVDQLFDIIDRRAQSSRRSVYVLSMQPLKARLAGRSLLAEAAALRLHEARRDDRHVRHIQSAQRYRARDCERGSAWCAACTGLVASRSRSSRSRDRSSGGPAIGGGLERRDRRALRERRLARREDRRCRFSESIYSYVPTYGNKL